jgi:S1-C subfamily serine protease
LARFFLSLVIAGIAFGSAHAASRTASYPALETVMPAPRTGAILPAIDIFKQTSPSIYLIVAAKDDAAMKRGRSIYEGSAVAITQNLALTNCHIVKGRKTLVMVQGKQLDMGVIVASDPRTDRCIIETQKMKLHPIAGVRPYGDIVVGEKVYTIGNPSGLTSTLGEGLVSGLRTQQGVRYVQTSAPISPGSSGGGLFDEHGNLLGITSFKIEDAENLNFAIAAEDYWSRAAAKKRRSRRKDAADAASGN